MPLYWLVYRHNNQISVVIEPGASLVHARMRAALADLDEGEFTKGLCSNVDAASIRPTLL
jgi:hypothetical protein